MVRGGGTIIMVLGVCAIQLSNPFAATSRIDLFGRTLARHHQSQLVGTPRCLALLAPHVIRRSHWPTTVVYDIPVTSKTALLGGRFTLIMSNRQPALLLRLPLLLGR